MGKESGLDLVEWARRQGSGAKVIFLTSYADFSYAQKAVTLQSFDYLLKQFLLLRSSKKTVGSFL